MLVKNRVQFYMSRYEQRKWSKLSISLRNESKSVNLEALTISGVLKMEIKLNGLDEGRDK